MSNQKTCLNNWIRNKSHFYTQKFAVHVKFQTFLFSKEMLDYQGWIHKILVRIANREDPDQTVSLGLFACN